MTVFRRESTEVSVSFRIPDEQCADYLPALHFKLAIPKVPSSEYEKAVFEYLPLLDANRDRDLVDILPDFLIDHITFEREQAPKFYTRVIDALTKRRSSTASRA